MSESSILDDIMKKRKQETLFPVDKQIANFAKDQEAASVIANPPAVDSNSLATNLGATATLASALKGPSATAGEANPAMSALGGAAAGATLGGPVGAVAGAALGTIGALAANKSKQRALNRQIEADKFKALAEIRLSQGQQEAQGLQNVIAGLRSSFLGR